MYKARISHKILKPLEPSLKFPLCRHLRHTQGAYCRKSTSSLPHLRCQWQRQTLSNTQFAFYHFCCALLATCLRFSESRHAFLFCPLAMLLRPFCTLFLPKVAGSLTSKGTKICFFWLSCLPCCTAYWVKGLDIAIPCCQQSSVWHHSLHIWVGLVKQKILPRQTLRLKMSKSVWMNWRLTDISYAHRIKSRCHRTAAGSCSAAFISEMKLSKSRSTIKDFFRIRIYTRRREIGQP